MWQQQQQMQWQQQQQYYGQYYQPYMAHKPAFFEITPLQEYLQKRHFEDQYHHALGAQILALTSKVDAWLAEAAPLRTQAYDLVCGVIRDAYPELSLNFDVYGSMLTKLAIDTSDMDISVVGVSGEGRAAAMHLIHQRLNACSCVISN